ncbi:MAG: 2-dehydropantoate 2-reductase N-terminal domain-containing protein [Pseudomonadota bacterium]
MTTTYQILILGASYGSLLGAKLAMAGHRVKLVGRPAEVELINADGVRLRLPVRPAGRLVELNSKDMAGDLSADAPDLVNPADYDFVILAMQEPQLAAADLAGLLHLVAAAKEPCLSIMNMPPLTYLRRIKSIDADALRGSYTDPGIWDSFDPALMTHCSPDPQAFRPPEETFNVLQVGLATNFKAARFDSDSDTGMLRQLEADIQGIRLDTVDGETTLPVKLRVYDSIFVPLAKWAMLMAGNYRCIQEDGMRSIKDAVYSDLEASKSVYDWIVDLCLSLGADRSDMVSFKKYANAALSLVKPSSAARALANGALHIERVDLLIQTVAAQNNMQSEIVDDTVNLVNSRLDTNRRKRRTVRGNIPTAPEGRLSKWPASR